MDEQLVSQIEELGLSNKEARVYLGNLMLGPAGVQQIADTSGIKRVTTYVILESLVSLGLVSQTTKAKKTLFNAEAPENLRRLLEKREQSLKDQKQQLSDLLPELNSLKTLTKEAPSVKLYDSAEGFQTINKMFYEEASKPGMGVSYGMSNLDRLYEFFPQIESNQGNPDRLKANVRSRFIYTSSKGPVMKATDAERNRESRYLPPEKFPIDGFDLSIAGNLIAILSFDGPKPMGVTLQSAQLAKGFKELFNLAWQGAERYNQSSD
jgi:sugar-specific transcriptional regulator TrmB